MRSNVSTTLDYDEHTLEAIADSADQISRVKKWFEESKKARESQSERWRKNEKLYYGQHWVETQKDSRTKLVYNFPLSVVETTMPIIADHLPTVDIMPKEQDDVMFADMVQSRFDQLADQSGLYDKILLTVKDSLIYSNGYLEVLPELDENGSLTGISVNVPDPYTVFPHYFATTMENANYIIFATPMHVNEIEQQYDVQVTPEGNLDDYRSFQTAVDDETREGDDMALVIECFSYDPDRETYPNGRFTAIAREQLLIDEPLELSRIPYFMVGNYKSAHTWYGIGEPDLVRTQTKTLNEVMSSIADNIREAGNPIRKMTPRFVAKNPLGINPHAGGKVVVDDPKDLTWDAPPSIPGYVQNYIQQTSVMMDAVTGVHDVTQGRQPTGVTAASAIAALQEAAQTRIRYKITKEISTMIKDVGNYVVDLIQTYDDQILSLRERYSGGDFEFKEFNPQAVDEKTGKTFSEGQFDITVATGFRQPSGRLAAEERALKLYELGVYGVEDIVMALNEPNKQDLIERFYKRQQEAQMQQQGGEQIPPEVIEQFQQLVEIAQPGTPEEEQLREMMEQYPELQEIIQA